MSRYIDADAIEYHEIYDGQEFVSVAYGDDIDELPSVDVVEVVRCKDCKHCEQRKTANYVTFDYCLHRECSVKNNGFCDYGERRTDE